MGRIIFLGAMHDDPAGKERLHRAIRNEIAKYKVTPVFIAFEYAHATYKITAKKRDELAAQLKLKMPGRGKDFHESLAKTLVYEPDLHTEIDPRPQLVWMLDGLENHDAKISGQSLADRAISVKAVNYSSWLLPKINNWESLGDEQLLEAATSVYMEESLRLASLTEADDGVNRSINAGRDSHMFNQLKSILDELKKSEGIGIIIVGTGHLINASGSLYNLCLNTGPAVERIWPHEQ